MRRLTTAFLESFFQFFQFWFNAFTFLTQEQNLASVAVIMNIARQSTRFALVRQKRVTTRSHRRGLAFDKAVDSHTDTDRRLLLRSLRRCNLYSHDA